ncbi:MAG: hypothetical protein WC749_09035 [Dehalococcoidia bacterium]
MQDEPDGSRRLAYYWNIRLMMNGMHIAQQFAEIIPAGAASINREAEGCFESSIYVTQAHPRGFNLGTHRKTSAES